MYDIYNDEHSETVLLVDAENAFNPFLPNAPFWPPWKHDVVRDIKTWCCQGDQKGTLGMKGLTQSVEM